MVSGGVLTQIATVSANVTSYADANLTSGLNYCYIVRAFNSAGVSDATNVACAVAMDSISTPAPGNPPPVTTPSPSPSNPTGTGSNDNLTTLTNDPVDGRSTRGAVLSGDNVMIAGFIISGDSPKTMLIRARGPTLADFGVPHVMRDPFLRLYSGQTVIAHL